MQYTCYFYCLICVCLWLFFPLDNSNKNPHTESNSCPGRMCANANNSIKAVLNYDTKSNAIPLETNKYEEEKKKAESCYMIRINLYESKNIWRGWFVFSFLFFTIILRISRISEDIDGGSAWKRGGGSSMAVCVILLPLLAGKRIAFHNNSAIL
jgi:hypothetical protein